MKFSLKIRIFILIVFTVLASFLISAIILRGNEYFSENILAGISLFLILILAAGTTLYRFLRDVVIQASRIISGPVNNEEIDSLLSSGSNYLCDYKIWEGAIDTTYEIRIKQKPDYRLYSML